MNKYHAMIGEAMRMTSEELLKTTSQNFYKTANQVNTQKGMIKSSSENIKVVRKFKKNVGKRPELRSQFHNKYGSPNRNAKEILKNRNIVSRNIAQAVSSEMKLESNLKGSGHRAL